jgi:hypothetical protein
MSEVANNDLMQVDGLDGRGFPKRQSRVWAYVPEIWVWACSIIIYVHSLIIIRSW